MALLFAILSIDNVWSFGAAITSTFTATRQTRPLPHTHTPPRWMVRHRSVPFAGRQRITAQANENDSDTNDDPSQSSFNSSENTNDDFDNDFSAWLETNLNQWPLLPTNEASSVTSLLNSSSPSRTTLSSGALVSQTERDDRRANSTLDDSIFLRRPVTTTATTTPVFSIDSLLQLTVSSATMSSSMAAAAASAVINRFNWTALEELGSLKFVGGVVQSTGKSAEVLLKQATMRMEALVAEASSAVSPEMIEALLRKSSETVYNVTTSSATTGTGTQSSTLGAASLERITAAPDATTYALSLLRTADGLFRKGYVAGSSISVKSQQSIQSIVRNVPVIAGSKALFDSFDSAFELNRLTPTLTKAAEMGALAGAIYEDPVSRTRALGQTIVARGTTEHVAWMVTDSIANQTSFRDTNVDDDAVVPFLVRTITIRGFDASDESVDREMLLNQICTANPVPISSKIPGVLVHSGLLEIALAIYKDIKPYLDWIAPSHKIVLNGHSIGGSVSLLLLFLMVKDYGPDYVKKNVARVYTFGCPPVAVMKGSNVDLLSALELPVSIVQGFIQPWDPIVRLFSPIDALYPLVGDLGPDNATPFANGPPRTLRPILKAAIESWDGWPRFRDNYKGTANQTFASVGVQHLLLPDPTRYLADRFVAMNIPVPPVETVVRISNKELYSALRAVFPLDVFEVSFVPQAIRSFVHHFYPAYSSPMVDYVKDLRRKSRGPTEQQDESIVMGELIMTDGLTPSAADDSSWAKATQWLVRNNGNNNAKP